MPKAYYIEYALSKYKAVEMEFELVNHPEYCREKVYSAIVESAITGEPDMVIMRQYQSAKDLKWGAIHKIKNKEKEKYLLKIATYKKIPLERDGQVVSDATYLMGKDPAKYTDEERVRVNGWAA